MNPIEVEIRPLAPDEHGEAWRVLHELRTALSRDRFERALSLQAREHRYLFVGAFSGAAILGVMGMRPVRTFARGGYLHVDDLVVTESARGADIGRRLLEYAEAHARREGLAAVFLDSRPEALGFYEREGYRRHESILVKKRLDGS